MLLSDALKPGLLQQDQYHHPRNLHPKKMTTTTTTTKPLSPKQVSYYNTQVYKQTKSSKLITSPIFNESELLSSLELISKSSSLSPFPESASERNSSSSMAT